MYGIFHLFQILSRCSYHLPVFWWYDIMWPRLIGSAHNVWDYPTCRWIHSHVLPIRPRHLLPSVHTRFHDTSAVEVQPKGETLWRSWSLFHLNVFFPLPFPCNALHLLSFSLQSRSTSISWTLDQILWGSLDVFFPILNVASCQVSPDVLFREDRHYSCLNFTIQLSVIQSQHPMKQKTSCADGTIIPYNFQLPN